MSVLISRTRSLEFQRNHSYPSKHEKQHLPNSNTKWVLAHHHDIPEHRRMKHILSGYRKGLTAKDCFLSLFDWHNETLNTWTHLIAFLVFVSIATYVYFVDLYRQDFVHQIIFGIFCIGATNCFFSSAVYHLFLGHSCDHVVSKATMFDFCGISLLILASFYPPIFYTFYCYPGHQFLYLGMITFLGLSGVILPQFQFYHTDKFASFRVLLMGGSAAIGVIPTVHAHFIPQPMSQYHISDQDIFNSIYLMYLCFAIGLVFYITKFPECSWPGKFDIWLHSHQLWHIFVFFGVLVHFVNCLRIFGKWQADYPTGTCPIIPSTTVQNLLL